MVAENDELPDERKAVTAYAEMLQKEVFPDLRIAPIHGKMKPKEKDAVMRAFAAHEIDVLVSTTVIEVGVDVPNAALMLIENAECFGLSQLHQLRGRVGRGRHKSYCVLVSDNKGEENKQRLKVMSSAARATFSAPASTACRRCASPISRATYPFCTRRSPPPSSSSPPTPRSKIIRCSKPASSFSSSSTPMP